MTATRLLGDGPLDALRRDPTGLAHGQVWRLISPVLVQSDPGLASIALVFAMCAAIGEFAERFLSPGRWLVLYVCGALVGHALGEAFQPLEGGTSVAFVGILGGLGAFAALGRDTALTRFKAAGARRPPARGPRHRPWRHPRRPLSRLLRDRGGLGPPRRRATRHSGPRPHRPR